MSDQRFSLLILDLDGTIIDSQNDIAAAVNYVRNRYEKPELDVETVRSLVGSGIRVLMEQALAGVSGPELKKGIEMYRDYYEAHLLDTTVLFPGIRETLESLRDKTKAILTNKPEEFSKKILKSMGIEKHFRIVWGGDTGPKRKPDPEPVREIMRRLNHSPEETLLIGDGINDLLSARAAGIKCAAVGYGYTSSQNLLALKPDYFLLSPEEIIKILS